MKKQGLKLNLGLINRLNKTRDNKNTLKNILSTPTKKLKITLKFPITKRPKNRQKLCEAMFKIF